MKDNKHIGRMGTSKTIMDGDKLIRVNTASLRKKYKDFENINKDKNTDAKNGLMERYRVPEDLIFSLFLDN